MRNKSHQALAAALLSGSLLAACQSNPPTTQDEAVNKEAVVKTDSAAAPVAKADSVPTIGSPQLLFTLDDAHNTPDGLALAPNGHLILSVPNLADNSQPASLMEIDGTTIKPFATNLPVEPTTKKAAPMDLAFGPDGNLYYAENQYENSKDFKSRLMKVTMKNGKPGAITTVVDNFALANAVVWKGNTIYVTDSQWDLPDNDEGSAILKFSLAELNKGTVHLKPKTMDPHVLATFTTTVNETGVDNGADGMDYDSKGNFYTGSFGDGKLYKVSLKPDGSLAKQETLQLKGKAIPCVDGLIIDRTTDKMYLCNSRENAIEIVDLRNGNAVTTLAQNGDTDGTGGKLDQPAEVLLKGKRLYISDFDKPEKQFVNSKSDAPHTMSVIDLP
ncbi:SMP-30/gluconolactonase/LRE family protein [Microvirga sp. STS02]|uniref:SMP-30/gluconolactonase/LRE family protein n=1 Tax=Hymenobacter negativus TaxID=2795026 RepID=UPI0018DB7B25|nr:MULTISPECIES: SMP-30/gluconolactonase/LRE family protein [Bacteria]MBH8569252.1 SMP-30/gluconolactonase/LRE family protein [Hymenobacter negativus]MBR7208987.1 SMP-30/gluconolactonase/LRE family protein [Microvirga sp. STS02]